MLLKTATSLVFSPLCRTSQRENRPLGWGLKRNGLFRGLRLGDWGVGERERKGGVVRKGSDWLVVVWSWEPLDGGGDPMAMWQLVGLTRFVIYLNGVIDARGWGDRYQCRQGKVVVWQVVLGERSSSHRRTRRVGDWICSTSALYGVINLTGHQVKDRTSRMMAGYTQPMRSWQSFSLSLPLNCDFHHNAITRQKKKNKQQPRLVFWDWRFTILLF